MEYSHLQSWYCHPRELSSTEKDWMAKMLDVDLPYRDILKEQVENSKAIGECKCGCRTINIQVDQTAARKFPYSIRIPVEMSVTEEGKPPILFLLHLIDGYIHELEVLRVDSTPIIGDIEFRNAEVLVNIE
ncbi:hypothetical protein V3851_06845 [Paenibacillus sp. M1]|uniref:Uncharacterized protein n=1 Tax=Paenibacillus haidiansis TaxID=1574488 RepID=A0ABU7VP60_9BACL